jgi:hypothetical protein
MYDKSHELNLRIPIATFTVYDTLIVNACPGDYERSIDVVDPLIDLKMMEWDLLREWGLLEVGW